MSLGSRFRRLPAEALPQCRSRGRPTSFPGTRERSATEAHMFKKILVPVDLADASYAKPAIAKAAALADVGDGKVRILNEEALAIVASESGLGAGRISAAVRQGGIYHEILEEAAAFNADLIVMTSHRPAMRTYVLGSNACHVVRYAKCSVLVVRQ
jgi:nucleotide-binding universal stress UspA family protein